MTKVLSSIRWIFPMDSPPGYAVTESMSSLKEATLSSSPQRTDLIHVADDLSHRNLLTIDEAPELNIASINPYNLIDRFEVNQPGLIPLKFFLVVMGRPVGPLMQGFLILSLGGAVTLAWIRAILPIG